MGKEGEPTQDTSSKTLQAISPFHVWLVLLVLGGGLLAVYYRKISYLPDIQWQDSLIYLAIASFIGITFGVLEVLAIFLPGYIWAEELVCDVRLRSYFCLGEPDTHEPCVSKIAKLLGIPFAICLIVFHLALLGGLATYIIISAILIFASMGYIWLRLVKFPPPITVRELVSKSFELFWSKVAKRTRANPDSNTPAKRDESELVNPQRSGKYMLWFGLSVTLNFLALLFIYLLAGWESKWKYMKLSLICTTTVLVSNHIVAARWAQNRRTAVLVSIIATLLLLVFTDQYVSLTGKIMAGYGIGSGHHYELVLTQEGADMVDKLSLSEHECEKAAQNRLHNIEILSGIGRDYYVQCGKIKFTIPKTMVLARSTTVDAPVCDCHDKSQK